MLLQIQKDEDISSFVSRHYDFYGEAFRVKNPLGFPLAAGRWRSSSVRALAETLGWKGCHGFNKLLHHHTSYFLNHYLAAPHKNTYSEQLYDISRRYVIGADHSKPVRICLKCAEEDMDRLGFVYWRAYHQQQVFVCDIHNTRLIDRCQTCSFPFALKGHHCASINNKCECKKRILDNTPTTNSDQRHYKLAAVISEIYKAPHFIDCSAVNELISADWSDIDLRPYQTLLGSVESPTENRSELIVSKHNFINNFAFKNELSLAKYISIFYDGLQDFLNDLSRYSPINKPLQETWGLCIKVTTQPSPNYPVATYTNPHTGKILKTRGHNQKTLNEWKNQYGKKTVNSWKSFDD